MPTPSTSTRDPLHFLLDQYAQAIPPRPRLFQPTLPISSFFDGPSETRARPRHHFRRGAISEASGPPNLFGALTGQINIHQELRIRSITANEIEVTIIPTSGRPQLTNPQISSTQLQRFQELADQIHRGLVDINNPSVQRRITTAAASLPQLIGATRDRSTMESGSGRRHHDTYRYGREGWGSAESGPDADQRPETMPGSTFAVPSSTLNLFQSVDLFALPEPGPTALESAIMMSVRVRIYCQRVENYFNQTVAARRRGCEEPRGKLFVLGMELSRLRQLRSILEDEYRRLDQAASDASRRRPTGERGRTDEQRRSSEGGSVDQQPPYNGVDDASSESDIGEPEGWSNLDIALDGDYPQEVCFHIENHDVTFPIEEVEAWMMDERRRDRWRTTEPHPVDEDDHRIRHTLAMPELARQPWLDNSIRTYEPWDDETDADELYPEYHQEEEGEDDGDEDEWYDRGDGDIPDTEYEVEDDDDDSVDTVENLDHEGWAEPGSQDQQPAEQISGGGVQSLDANRRGTGPNLSRHPPPTGSNPPPSVTDSTSPPPSTASSPDIPLIDLTNSPSPTESQNTSRNTSDESSALYVTSSETEVEQEFHPPHPNHDWAFDHTLFMYSCRGNIFDVTRQVQRAFGFQPEVNPHMVGQRLNGEFAAQHRGFIRTFLPGEEGTNIRSLRRAFAHENQLSDDDVYHGTQNIAESDLESEAYSRPPLPAMMPACWDRRLDIYLLQDLNRGRFNCQDFWDRHHRLGNLPLSTQPLGFLSIRLAQVRYLGISREEVAADPEIGVRG
jgi:hypothetical protein